MTMAKTVEGCLERHYLPYSVIFHSRALCSRDTAQAAAVPAERIAKAVLLADANGYVMAVVPGDSHVVVDVISRDLQRDLHLVNETRLQSLFADCEAGAIPPLGPAYGIETVVDDRVLDLAEVYFVAGDHAELVRVDRNAFLLLLKDAKHGRISRPSH